MVFHYLSLDYSPKPRVVPDLRVFQYRKWLIIRGKYSDTYQDWILDVRLHSRQLS